MMKFSSKNSVTTSIKCTVRLLEDTQLLDLEFQCHEKGSTLITRVCEELDLIEKDYFGLRYVDNKRQRHWLEPSKSIIKQMRDVEADNILFSFRVKFYPPNPFRLKEDITRYQIYLQLKRDLLHGRLYCNTAEAALLGAYILQAELGDFNPDEHIDNYVTELKILLKQTQQLEEKMMEIHKNELNGKTVAEVETMFLKKACVLDTYGVDPHAVKDQRGNQLYLGINHTGILTFQGSKKINHFSWSQVQKINYEGKMFIIHVILNEDQRIKKKQTVGFKCPKGSSCRHVWKCAIEQMLFFTFSSSSDVPHVVSGGGFFSWGTKFRYSGRVEREILEDMSITRESPSVTRVASLRRKSSSEPATPSTIIDNSHSVLETLIEDQETNTPKKDPATVTDYCSPSLSQTVPNHQISGQKRVDNKSVRRSRSPTMSFICSTILPIVLTLFLVFMIVVVVLESDIDFLVTIRKRPEIAAFKINYYDLGKEFIVRRFIRSKMF
ncbi:FERM domain-containing protein 3 isoform X5 [Adelges cooleyi]|uniref:FERM domain-containing protein 3 isoform X5 n=1 Tax=Adelges cooleyi TaxID=133065 RepID=UPI0021803839|nr:FERM domain-containing protein 3 isoform X5 [Adelges cooleyi]